VKALLLHGETRPMDVSSSQSNQHIFSFGSRFCFGPGGGYRRDAVGRALAVSGQTWDISPKLACGAHARLNQAQDQSTTYERLSPIDE
jgi:hypothetical protein